MAPEFFSQATSQTAARSPAVAAASAALAVPVATPLSPAASRGMRTYQAPWRPEMIAEGAFSSSVAHLIANDEDAHVDAWMERIGTTAPSPPARPVGASFALSESATPRNAAPSVSRPGPGYRKRKASVPSLSCLPRLAFGAAGAKTVSGVAEVPARTVGAPSSAGAQLAAAPRSNRASASRTTTGTTAAASRAPTKAASYKAASSKAASYKAASSKATPPKASSSSNVEGEAVKGMLALAGMREGLEGLLSGSDNQTVALAGQSLGALFKVVKNLEVSKAAAPDSSATTTPLHPATVAAGGAPDQDATPTPKRFKTSTSAAPLLPPAEPSKSVATGNAPVIEPQPEVVAEPALRVPPISTAMRATIAKAAAITKKQAEGLATMAVARRLLNPRYKKILA